jgi:hypothetical protein
MTIAILNQEELIEPLARQMLIRHISNKIKFSWNTTDDYVAQCKETFTKKKLLDISFDTVNQSMHRDYKIWKDLVMAEYKGKYRDLIKWLVENLGNHELDRDYLIKLCLKDPEQTFVKTLARLVSKHEPYWHLRGEINATEDVVVLRNVIGNENILSYKLAKSGSMWFIDSGYTNFLTGKKVWHRLVKNHIHHDLKGLKFPADRLRVFSSFPEPWRPAGEKILVVESSEEYYRMIGTTLEDWRNKVTTQLQIHTDRPVEFKSKSQSRKDRISVYEQLKNNPSEYYCVISDSSAAAIEAIWMGVPVITLGQHVSTPVARTSIADINNLYRGPLGDWLCALSYCQYTQSEILDGTALKFIRKYFNV